MSLKITGTHPIEEALKGAKPGAVLLVQSDLKKNSTLIFQAKRNSVRIKKVSKSEIDKISPSHQGAVLIMSEGSSSSLLKSVSVSQYLSSITKEYQTVVILDGITDPHNLGAIIRSIDMLGADAIMLPQRKSGHINETVLKTSSGAAKYVSVINSVNLARDIEALKKAGFWIYALDMDGTSIVTQQFDKKIALVAGSEGSGLRRLTKELCDYTVTIPTFGHIDSLNVSVATAIAIYQAQQRIKLPLA